jgi:nitrogen regulatory protein PII
MRHSFCPVSKIVAQTRKNNLQKELFIKMKMISAYVRTQCSTYLIRELHKAGVGGLTAYTVRGMSGETTTFLYSKRPFEVNHLPESLKIEVICDDASTGEIVALIARMAKTGAPGDGIIAIQDVERVVRIRDT